MRVLMHNVNLKQWSGARKQNRQQKKKKEYEHRELLPTNVWLDSMWNSDSEEVPRFVSENIDSEGLIPCLCFIFVTIMCVYFLIEAPELPDSEPKHIDNVNTDEDHCIAPTY